MKIKMKHMVQLDDQEVLFIRGIIGGGNPTHLFDNFQNSSMKDKLTKEEFISLNNQLHDELCDYMEEYCAD